MCRWQKVCFWINFILTTFFWFACNSKIVANERPVIPPDVWQTKKAVGGADCINITGKYSLWGEGSPQTPRNFQGVPFSLDVMLGIDLSRQDRKQITHVEIEQRDGSEIMLTFFMEARILNQKKISQVARSFSCGPDKVILVTKSVNTVGEATTGVADIEETLFLGEDGSLIVNTVINGIGKSLIFKWRHKEEYWVKFNAIE